MKHEREEVAFRLFRMTGVAICLIGTPLNAKGRLFYMIAYTPKATVQAAIGGCRWQWGFPAARSC